MAGSGNQSFFLTDNESELQTSRLFYQVLKGGTHHYSFLYSNIIDTTFADGCESQKNLICDSWSIEKAAVAVCRDCDCANMPAIDSFTALTFGGRDRKEVMPGEFFSSDPVELSPNDGEYLCIELSFRGKMLPNHPETLIPSFLLERGQWVPSVNTPFPGMFGCDRKVSLRVAFLGDSITQGIGTQKNSYTHWNACVAKKLGTDYAYWNLGLGYARAADASSNGAWLFKAKQADVAVVCLGVNDILDSLRHYTAEQICGSLFTIVQKLRAAGVPVMMQTVPPFDYADDKIGIWKSVNQYIKSTLAQDCDRVFDTVPALSTDSGDCPMAKYGGHPNAEGCAKWADALYPALKSFADKYARKK